MSLLPLIIVVSDGVLLLSVQARVEPGGAAGDRLGLYQDDPHLH